MQIDLCSFLNFLPYANLCATFDFWSFVSESPFFRKVAKWGKECVVRRRFREVLFSIVNEQYASLIASFNPFLKNHAPVKIVLLFGRHPPKSGSLSAQFFFYYTGSMTFFCADEILYENRRTTIPEHRTRLQFGFFARK